MFKKLFPILRRMHSILRKNALQVCEECFAFIGHLKIVVVCLREKVVFLLNGRGVFLSKRRL